MNNTLTQDKIAGVIRTVLAGVGGLLVGKWGLTEGSITLIVGGVVPILTAAVWSWFSKDTEPYKPE